MKATSQFHSVQKSVARSLLWLAVVTSVVSPVHGQSAANLETGFRTPPPASRPRTLWMWMNGNVTADGIRRDLEAMRDVGLGGALIFNVGEYIPKGPVDYGEPEWLKLVTQAAREADRLGLKLAMHNCPGWSSSGGPWITPEMSMQQLVWSDAKVAGPEHLDLKLPQPFTKLNFYRDVCVLAFPSLPGEEQPFAHLLAGVRTGRGELVDPKLVTDGDLDTGVRVSPQDPLVLEFRKSFEARSLAVYPNAGGSNIRFTLEAGNDGVHFTNVTRLVPQTPRAIEQAPSVANFTPVRARFFRVVPSRSRQICEVRLNCGPRIDGWGYRADFSYRAARQEGLPAEPAKQWVIDPGKIVDLTRQMDSQGRLTWEVPPGQWTILRFGHTASGRQNIAAPDAGVGLECDKLSREAVRFHVQHGLGRLLEDLGPLAGKSFTALEVDSYEVGMQNWTEAFPAEFRKLNGYDLRRCLPAMTGRFVGSADVSERFLWDVRRTLAQMVADCYYGQLRELCHQHGLQLYIEPYGAGPGDYDELQVGGRADMPMGEFWAHFPWDDITSVRMAASAAHVYGRPVVGGESFTATEEQSRYLDYPYALKTTGDLVFSLGLNQMYFHRYVHQPHPSAVPGMTMGPWGFMFDRNVTWFNHSRGWLDYLARCQYLLRQGSFVADVLYFTGEGSPQRSRALTPELPPGYDFDSINAEALLSRAQVSNGRILLPGGSSYRLLALPPDLKNMTPGVLRKLRDLVASGMTLVGPRPVFSPSLQGYPGGDAEVRRLTDEMWGAADEANGAAHVLGRGRVFPSQGLPELLLKLGIKPDFEYSSRRPGAALCWLHRRLGQTDIYFVANRQRRSEDVVCTFRIQGRRPEFWRPETGRVQSAVVYDFADGRVHVPMRLGPAESVFVVFRAAADSQPRPWLARDGRKIMQAEGFPQPAAAQFAGVTNNFTIAAWINPDTDLQSFPRESIEGTVNDGGKSYLVPAPDGEALYGPGHAAMGIGAGRNGVFVVERSGGEAPAVLVSRTPISGWTHLAVTCRDGRPSLYLNGKFIHAGLVSGKTVHPGMDAPPPGRRIVHYFDGDMTPPILFRRTLSEAKIAELASEPLPGPAGPAPIDLARRDDGKVGALIWQNGSYSLDDGSCILVTNLPPPLQLVGPWQVAFPPGRGAPSQVTLPNLVSLSRNADPGVRYFSGTASYKHSFLLSGSALADGRRVYLDLGRVAVMAGVKVNGRNVGLLWKPPFRVDITDAARSGKNEVEVDVTDLWPNRLIGDEFLPAENEYNPRTHAIMQLPGWYRDGKPKPPGGRVTFSTWHFYSKDDPLVDSGLLGPVRLFFAEQRAFGEPR